MKDQYFGDVNDYRKYGLLRTLITGTNLRLGVCWMLTEPDGRSDGRHLAYLGKPRQFRACDPELFDWLRNAVQESSDRRTARIEQSGLLNAVYFSDLLPVDWAQRHVWYERFWRQLSGCDLIFFDPDNGIEPAATVNRRSSNKYLYWGEMRKAFRGGLSVLVYQHFPRKERTLYVDELAGRARDETGAAAIFTFRTPHTLFLLASQERHCTSFRAAVRGLSNRWPGRQITVDEIHPKSCEIYSERSELLD